MVRQAGTDLEYLVLADSVLLLQTQDETIAITDDREAQVGRQHRSAMDALPSGSPEHVAAHRAYIETLRGYRNRVGGFWVASVDPAVATEAIVGLQPTEGLQSVLLLSDGASRLVDRFDLTTWPGLVELVGLERPDAVID